MRATVLALAGLALASLATVAADARAPEWGITEPRILVQINPDTTPIQTAYDNSSGPAVDISANDSRIAKATPGCTDPEQVRITYWTSSSVLVSWSTCDPVTGASPANQTTTGKEVKKQVKWGLDGSAKLKTATGIVTTYYHSWSAGNVYASARIHHVLLRGVKAGTAYTYQITGDTDAGTTRTFKFTMPKASFPFKLGVIADPGQTYNTTDTISHLDASGPDMISLIGDFCYADVYASQLKWDTWGRLFEPLLSKIPFHHTNGNHEIETDTQGTRDMSYNVRYPVSQKKSAAPSKSTLVGVKTGAKNSGLNFTNLYHSIEVPGVLKHIMLTSYAPGQLFGNKSDIQYAWAEAELKKVNRKKTPWLIVSMHSPWYNSYKSHYKENECMRVVYEPLMLKYGADVMLFGHVHAYERTKPLANYKIDKCGPIHITVGDGGNVEGLSKTFINDAPTPGYCADPKANYGFPSYQPLRCFSFENDYGGFCWNQQPPWSAYREPSFGHGVLEIKSATAATWTWRKNQAATTAVGDTVDITRSASDEGACAKRRRRMKLRRH